MELSATDLPTNEFVTRTRVRVPGLVIVACIVVLAVTACAIAPQLFYPQNPLTEHLLLTATGPSAHHLLGTDQLGRDVLSLLIAGTRAALLGPVVIAVGTLLLGASLGVLAGYFGGALDAAINGFANLLYALPGLLMVIVVLGVIGGGYWLAVLVLLVLSIPSEIRLCRAATAIQRQLPYVEAATTLALSSRRIMLRHIVPNILPTIIAIFMLDFVGALLGLAGLAYLGFGVPPGTPDWGSLLHDGQTLLGVNPWMSVAPSVMIILTATSVTLIGDWLYDRSLQENR